MSDKNDYFVKLVSRNNDKYVIDYQRNQEQGHKINHLIA